MYDYPLTPMPPLTGTQAVLLLLLVVTVVGGAWWSALQLCVRAERPARRRKNVAANYSQDEIDDELAGIINETIRAL